jgi:DNA-binding NarL/FixJ family response regulator
MIQILIVDDHPLFRKTLGSIIKSQTDMNVTGEAENGIDAIKQTEQHQPDIILMDLQMPKMDGICATSQIRSRYSHIKIIALSSYTEEIYMKKMLEAGASYYLSKMCSRTTLINCIRTVWSDESLCKDTRTAIEL